jgi:hypothetical protein
MAVKQTIEYGGPGVDLERTLLDVDPLLDLLWSTVDSGKWRGVSKIFLHCDVTHQLLETSPSSSGMRKFGETTCAVPLPFAVSLRSYPGLSHSAGVNSMIRGTLNG